MSYERQDLVRLHESFRFISYLLLIASLYLSRIDFFAVQGFYIPEFEGLFQKLAHLDFLSDIHLSKTFCLLFLMITCVGTKAHKDRELRVSSKGPIRQ